MLGAYLIYNATHPQLRSPTFQLLSPLPNLLLSCGVGFNLEAFTMRPNVLLSILFWGTGHSLIARQNNATSISVSSIPTTATKTTTGPLQSSPPVSTLIPRYIIEAQDVSQQTQIPCDLSLTLSPSRPRSMQSRAP